MVVLVLSVAATGVGLISPWLLGRIVDTVGGGGGAGGGGGGDTAAINRLALVIVIAAVVQMGLVRTARVWSVRFGEGVAARVREQFVERVLRLPTPVVERVGTGDLVTRGTGDVATVTATLRDGGPDVLIAVVQTALILGAVVLTSPALGVLAALGLVGMVLVSRWYSQRARGPYLAVGAASSELAEVLTTTASGARTIEALGLGPERLRISLAAIGDARRTRLDTLSLRTRLFPALDVLALLPLVGVLLLGGVLVGRDLLSVGAVFACAMYLRQLEGPLNMLKIVIDQVQSGAASFARLEALAGVPVPTLGLMDPADERFRVDGVSYAYADGPAVLHDVALDIRPGERLAVVGASGAGKTTLGRLLAGLDAPGTGSVTVGGVPVVSLPPEILRRHVVLVTQEPHVFAGSLRDNLIIAAPGADDARLLAALAAVGMAAVDLDASELSPAEAQQVALARVVLADPHTLVLDEATAMLDPRTARDTERALSAVMAGRTVVAIAHRLHTAHDADRVAVMDAGRIVELGTHDELVAAGGSYAALWRAWHG